MNSDVTKFIHSSYKDKTSTMRHAFLTFLLLVSLTCISQRTAFYPNGQRVPFQWNSVHDLLDSLGESNTDGQLGPQGSTIYFRRLTKTPVVVLLEKGKSAATIPAAIASYDYNSYINSYSYYWDLKDMMQSGSLTKEYLHKAFGDPTKTIQDSASSTLSFWKHNCMIEFEHDSAVKVHVANYEAMKKYGLSITSYSVTGSESTIGFEVDVANFTSKKDIKYLHFTVCATNPVHDVVETKTVRAIGPIKPRDVASYEFSDIIYSNVAQYLEIQNIRIVYMDGSEATVPKKSVEQIRLYDWEEIGNRREGQ